MTGNEAYRLENTYPVLGIESEAAGVFYFVDDDKQGIVISGVREKVWLTVRQAKAVCRELPGIVRDFL